MFRCQVDDTIQRRTIDGFPFPLGVYPVEEMAPKPGYTVEFEPADSDDGGEGSDWESWPDRYVFDIVVPATRIASLWDQFFALMPGRVFPILDYIGHDAFREIDPYMAYEPVGKERMVDGLRRYRPFLFEDGMVGFGAVSEEPFFYMFVDEHKILTVRAEPQIKPRIEGLLKAFDLEPIEDPAGADAAAHEHRSVLLTPADRPELMTADEVIERLRDRWQLVLNIDPETNLDDDGSDLGFTHWRCLVRCATEKTPEDRYAEILCSADRLRRAEDLAMDRAAEMLGEPGSWSDIVVIAADRTDIEGFGEMIRRVSGRNKLAGKRLATEQVFASQWLEPAP